MTGPPPNSASSHSASPTAQPPAAAVRLEGEVVTGRDFGFNYLVAVGNGTPSILLVTYPSTGQVVAYDLATSAMLGSVSTPGTCILGTTPITANPRYFSTSSGVRIVLSR